LSQFSWIQKKDKYLHLYLFRKREDVTATTDDHIIYILTH